MASGPWLFPAQAGVILKRTSFLRSMRSIPRASGGYPMRYSASMAAIPYSPRKRGLSPLQLADEQGAVLFPAQAGVILTFRSYPPLRRTIPRASGGYLVIVPRVRPHPPYSPRKRGLSPAPRSSAVKCQLFPAQAGVISTPRPCHPVAFSIPRASGDYPPMFEYDHSAARSYSPRKRGLSSLTREISLLLVRY